MTEPPAKRAKRTDSSAMWERNSPRPIDGSLQARATNGTSSIREKREDRDRHHGRDDRRHRSRSKERRRDRSRSKDRPEKPRKERSYSQERGARRHKDAEQDGIRDRRDKERNRSREKHRSRRGWCSGAPPKQVWEELTNTADEPPSRRSRSRSPRRDQTSARTRTRTPPRSSKLPRSRSPPPKSASDRAPPTGPRALTRNPSAKPPRSSSTDTSSKHTAKVNGTTSSTEPAVKQEKDAMEVDVDSDPEMAEMRRAMGFTGFKSTKNTKVKGNNVYGVRKEKKTEYRQYMNRVGGFNRPLSPSR